MLLLSEGRTINQSGRSVVFDPEPCYANNFLYESVFLQRKRDFIVSAALCHESHFPDAF